jgi:hypothetical protein
LTNQGGTQDCGSQECKFAARYVDWKVQSRITNASKAAALAKQKCINKSVFPTWLNRAVQSNAYDTCVWSWKAGSYCDQGTGTSMDDLDAAASNACAKFRMKGIGTQAGKKVGFGTGTTKSSMVLQDLQKKCPDPDDNGQTCYQKGGGIQKSG